MKIIIYPVRLTFKLDRHKHTVATAERWESCKNAVNLTGNIRAVIASDEAEGLAILRADCAEFAKSMDCDPADFTLVYSACKIEDGRAWQGGGVVANTQII